MQNADERKNKKSNSLLKNTLDIIPIRNYNDDLEAFELENFKYLDMVEFVAKDRNNLPDDEVDYDIASLIKFLKIYSPDIKFLILNFFINTLEQRENKHNKLSRTVDPIRKKWLEREIRELEIIEDNVVRTEYFVLIFGDKKEEFLKNKEDLIKNGALGQTGFFKEIDKTKKIKIYQKLGNMNTLVSNSDI